MKNVNQKKPKTIGIVGTRERNTNADLLLTIKAFLKIYQKGDMIVSGGCPKGGDWFARIIASKYDVVLIEHPAEWMVEGVYDDKAGLKRNTLIARDSDVLIACVAENRKGGTEDTISKFKKMYPDREVILV